MRIIFYILILYFSFLIPSANAIDKSLYPDAAVSLIITRHNATSGGNCLGVFIDSWHVITAAHCVIDIKGSPVNPRVILIQQPDKPLIPTINNMDTSNLLRVDSVNIHPDFKGTSYADIAVLKLSQSVSLPNNDTDKTLEHGNLNRYLNNVDSLLWTVYRSQVIKDSLGNKNIQLNYHQTKLFPGQKARQKFVDIKNTLENCGITNINVNLFADIEHTLIDNFIFAFNESDKEIYKPSGSSGGPIISYDQNDYKYWFLDGILSGGKIYKCGEKYYSYEIYVSNYAFANWIDSIVGYSRKKRSIITPPDAKKQKEIQIDFSKSGTQYSIPKQPNNATGFLAYSGVLHFPSKLVWNNSNPTKFVINLKDSTGIVYPVNLSGTLGYGACRYGALNSTATCNSREGKGLILNFDDNEHLPKNLTLMGSFKLLRKGWHDPSFKQIYQFNVTYQSN
ncbi:trypsin-like serine protease [Shewanella marina]|uniref:trypsin-like serine protease n=1 Tax=Shewanella marina TaxID=487319 RepID=UPI00046FBB35|nr:trypsin-like serine protease [Shewanella marina]